MKSDIPILIHSKEKKYKVEIIRENFSIKNFEYGTDGVKVTNLHTNKFVFCDEFRSQKRNYDKCIEMLEEDKI